MSDAAQAVVGVGASAGGLDAFRLFFENMPADSGLAFVVVLHLPHNRKSMLPEILRRWASMPVDDLRDGTRLAANHIYVPPPNAVTTIVDGVLRVRVRDADAPRDDRPIDGFFDSLAGSLRERAIGIVLSGTGSDGALGLKAIKAASGLTFAQGSTPLGSTGQGRTCEGSTGEGSTQQADSPQYDGMPSGAIATGAVDMVVPVQAMPAELVRLHRARQAWAREAAREPHDGPPEGIEAERLRICDILRGRVGHDFSGYKDKTFLRRVQRRMQVCDIDTVPDYIARLEADHDEAVLLFKDLLIRVTSFFRDAETFEVLARDVMPGLFAGKEADDTVRVWVPGCATGEEAYSLAMLLREHMDTMRAPPRVQVFATDIDEPAIATARIGRYPAMLLEGLSDARRGRFFTHSGQAWVVTREIRDLCTFSAHSVARDPPFSRMNLISCRNLLIYLGNDLQSEIIPAFHYALAKGGILLLGSSESTARHDDLFEPLDTSARTFRRRDVRGPPLALRRAERGEKAARCAPSAPRLEGRRLDLHQSWHGPGHGPGPDPGSRVGQGFGSAPAPNAQARPRTRGLIDRTKAGLRTAWGLPPLSDEAEALRRNLRATQDALQSVTEEHETALQDLRSSNEELHSVNEELQSTNEELETSKEELQSVNEELHTVNAQLSEKVDELDRNASDLKNLFDSTEIATIFLDRYLVIRGFTPAVCSIYNLIPSDQGRPLTDIVSHLRYDGLRHDVETVLDTLQPLERRVTRADRAVHYIMRILPYRAADSSVDGTLVTFLDVTSVVQAETHQRLLVDELNHRVRNMLNVVISLATQTLRRTDTLEAFSEAFMGRLKALTASYTLLGNTNWNEITLREVLMEDLRPFGGHQHDTIVLDGPEIRLAPQAALALGMAVHELATNAVKHGALSSPSGVVHVGWRIDKDASPATFVLEWFESGGPAVVPPVRKGFGATLIERSFAHELSGSISLDFAPAGLCASLRAPIGVVVFDAADGEVR